MQRSKKLPAAAPSRSAPNGRPAAIVPARPPGVSFAAKIFIHAFILFHLVAFITWSLPSDGPFRKAICDRIAPYMMWSGLWQQWNMFSPDPRFFNTYVTAEVTFRDGSQTVWEFPRVEKMGYWQRYQKERYRKWANDHVRQDEDFRIWEPTAQYVIRQVAKPGNPAVRVQLTRHWAMIPKPTKPNLQQPFEALEQWHAYTFYNYAVPPGLMGDKS